ncbi:MAG TPA: hypothetical protein DCG58_03920, partial [Hyphomonas adhaerens]|nr:hypothetical protein [Hyphomonas adhaerens]
RKCRISLFSVQCSGQEGALQVWDNFPKRVIPDRAAVWGSISGRCLRYATRMTYLPPLSEMGIRMAVGHRV